jgi:hypothetical protein
MYLLPLKNCRPAGTCWPFVGVNIFRYAADDGINVDSNIMVVDIVIASIKNVDNNMLFTVIE